MAPLMDDWNERIVCPDESCTGTLDREGRCRVCGGLFPESVSAPLEPSQEAGPDEPETAAVDVSDAQGEESAASPNEPPEEIETVDIDDSSGDAEEKLEEAVGVDDSSGDAEETPDDADWENRRLCPDESCIGTIGPDGRCTVCGLSDVPR